MTDVPTGLQEWTDRGAKVLTLIMSLWPSPDSCSVTPLSSLQSPLYSPPLPPPSNLPSTPLHSLLPPISPLLPSTPSPTAASVLKGSFSLPNVSYSSGLLDPRSTNYTSLASLIHTQVRHEYWMLFYLCHHTLTLTPSPPHHLTVGEGALSVCSARKT